MLLQTSWCCYDLCWTGSVISEYQTIPLLLVQVPFAKLIDDHDMIGIPILFRSQSGVIFCIYPMTFLSNLGESNYHRCHSGQIWCQSVLHSLCNSGNVHLVTLWPQQAYLLRSQRLSGARLPPAGVYRWCVTNIFLDSGCREPSGITTGTQHQVILVIDNICFFQLKPPDTRPVITGVVFWQPSWRTAIKTAAINAKNIGYYVIIFIITSLKHSFCLLRASMELI